MKSSNRLVNIPESPIRKLVPYALAAKKQGRHVYHLNIGDPDIKTPQVMMDELKTWDKNPIGYANSQGEAPLLSALANYYAGIGFDFIAQSDIQITLGGSEALAWAMFAVTEPGDEMLTFEPFYANYQSFAAIHGIRLRAVPTDIANGFHPPDCESFITPKTKAILYCSPNNPTGTVYTKQEIAHLVAIAKKHNLFLLADETYREYTYDGKIHASLFSHMQEIPEQAIVADSLSKRYSACGIRIGALVSKNTEIMAGVLRIAKGRLSAGYIDQAIAARLSDVPVSYMRQIHDEFELRRDVLFEGLKNIPGVTIARPEGAFYTIARLPVGDAEDFCQWLLTDFADNGETVMLAPAAGFYATAGMGKNEVRIAYVLNTKDLTRCIEILKKALNEYKK